MDSDRLNRWLTLLANLGVIAGIVVLVIEIQQANRIAIASKEIEVSNSFASINESIYSDPILAELLVKLTAHNPTLTPAEEEQISSFVSRMHNSWYALDLAFVNGLVTTQSHNVIEDNVRAILEHYPGTAPYFREYIDSYPALSESHVNKTIERQLEGRSASEEIP